MTKALSRQLEVQFRIDDSENAQERNDVNCIVFFRNVHMRETSKSLFYYLFYTCNFAIYDFFSKIIFDLIFLYDMINID